jgi:hydrogenase expression/formation protein HypE
MAMAAKTASFDGLQCPIPLADYPRIVMAHGGGENLTHQLVERMFRPAFQGKTCGAAHDGAVLTLPHGRLAFTTDSHVVSPLFFPGGDIGTLAVFGTANDLAMCGAKPLALSASFILEEGFEMEALWRIVCSMRDAAAEAGVKIVTGDTKVVERGKGDGIYINTAGVGVVPPGVDISPARIRPGDAVILSGDLGRHGIAIISARGDLALASTIESDCAPLARDVGAMLAEPAEVHCLRDLTRGGLAAALVASGLQIDIREEAIPVRADVQGACELLGFDPLHLANEGRFIAIARPEATKRILQVLGEDRARVIGAVAEGRAGLVTLKTALGTRRVVSMLSGEQLPRIC